MFVGGTDVKMHVFGEIKNASADPWERNRAASGSFIFKRRLKDCPEPGPKPPGQPSSSSEVWETFLTALQSRVSFPRHGRGVLWDTTAGKLIVSSCMKNVKFFSPNHPVTCCEFANHISPRVRNIMEPDSSEVGARSPQHKRFSAVVSRHHRSNFFWLPTQSTEPQKRNEEVGSWTSRKLCSQSKLKYLGRSGTADVRSNPRLLWYPCSHAKGNSVFTSAYSTVFLGLPLQQSSFALPLAQVCKPHLKQLSTMNYNLKFYLQLTVSYH